MLLSDQLYSQANEKYAEALVLCDGKPVKLFIFYI